MTRSLESQRELNRCAATGEHKFADTVMATLVDEAGARLSPGNSYSVPNRAPLPESAGWLPHRQEGEVCALKYRKRALSLPKRARGELGVFVKESDEKCRPQRRSSRTTFVPVPKSADSPLAVGTRSLPNTQ